MDGRGVPPVLASPLREGKGLELPGGFAPCDLLGERRRRLVRRGARHPEPRTGARLGSPGKDRGGVEDRSVQPVDSHPERAGEGLQAPDRRIPGPAGTEIAISYRLSAMTLGSQASVRSVQSLVFSLMRASKNR